MKVNDVLRWGMSGRYDCPAEDFLPVSAVTALPAIGRARPTLVCSMVCSLPVPDSGTRKRVPDSGTPPVPDSGTVPPFGTVPEFDTVSMSRSSGTVMV